MAQVSGWLEPTWIVQIYGYILAIVFFAIFIYLEKRIKGKA